MIEMGISNVKDFFELCAYIISSISFIAIWVTYSQSKKQIHFATIEKCIDDYRELYHKYPDKYENPKFLDEYLDLVNEELFYMEKDYLPKEVAEEWIDGMIDYLPFITSDGFFASQKFHQLDNKGHTEIFLFSYPRIYNFISVKGYFDFEKIFLPLKSKDYVVARKEERNKLVNALQNNLKGQGKWHF